MRGALLFAIYGGDAWIAAGATIVVVALGSIGGLFDDRPRLVRAARALTLVALAIAAFTGTPVRLWLALPAVAALLVFASTLDHRSRRIRLVFAVSALGIGATLTALEASHLYRRPVRTTPPQSMTILGDSLTSGGFGENARWPQLVARRCGIQIDDRSSPSASTADAIAIERSEPRIETATLFLEIGGNDMLDGGDASNFRRNLDTLAGRTPTRDVIMLEFPVLPGKWAFASAQRRIARRHGATLIPKRLLAAVLTDPRNTFDALHLTDRGHEELARRIAPWLGCR